LHEHSRDEGSHVGIPPPEEANMGAEKTSATESLLAKMRGILDELDEQSHPIAAAYVSQAIAVIEGQDAVGRASRV
jgi:hypothetical protein